MNSSGELKDYLRALALAERGAERCQTEHLDEQALFDFYEGRLRAEERWEARLHLEMCAQCGERLIDVEDFCAPLRVDEMALSELEVRRQWKELAQRLPFVERASNTDPAPSFWQSVLARFQSPMALALAAGLVLMTSLAGFFAIKLREETRAKQAILRRLEQGQVQMTSHLGAATHEQPAGGASAPPAPIILPQPQANTPVFNIHLAQQRQPGEPTRETYFAGIPANAAFFTISVTLADDAYQTYALEFAMPNGSPVWQQGGLRPNERASSNSNLPSRASATLSLSMPKQLLGEGTYLFKIYGQPANAGALKAPAPVLLKEYDWSLDLPH